MKSEYLACGCPRVMTITVGGCVYKCEFSTEGHDREEGTIRHRADGDVELVDRVRNSQYVERSDSEIRRVWNDRHGSWHASLQHGG